MELTITWGLCLQESSAVDAYGLEPWMWGGQSCMCKPTGFVLAWLGLHTYFAVIFQATWLTEVYMATTCVRLHNQARTMEPLDLAAPCWRAWVHPMLSAGLSMAFCTSSGHHTTQALRCELCTP